MKIIKRTASLLALILVAGFLMTGPPIAAQSKAESSSPSNSKRVEVGDPKVTGSHLKAYTNLWKFTQQKPGGGFACTNLIFVQSASSSSAKIIARDVRTP